ncbi:tRNA(Ile)-lysidine synthase [Aliidiomarina maris]|uniref:tRNA(Ile)-lysidine synthase n=1 Tax=Aliidiomarina maris TaxID=531312 RepID=A0A327X736_9GAMM|nr:tRNA(Ile)-lysidine synthase [Aliidiomarina maris]
MVAHHSVQQGPLSIVVALGGGADSQSVLDLTLRYREEHPQHHYLAIHLDHYFHPHSPKWAEFLRQQCIQHGIAHIVEPLDVPKQGRASKEALGREARYSRMAQLTDPRAVILLGHHLSDQSETFLLQLKRGAGPKGLAAMAPIAPFTDQRLLVRPLLGLNKAQIYQYAQARKLQWIEDDTNTDTRIERNFLRHQVLPVLTARWPQFETTLARSAALCAEQQNLLDELLAAELASRSDGQRLHIEGFLSYSSARQRALIRQFIDQQNQQLPTWAPQRLRLPSQAQLEQVISQLANTRAQVSCSDYQLCSFANYLYLVPHFGALTDVTAPLPWPTEAQPSQVILADDIGVVVATWQSEIPMPLPTDLLAVSLVQDGDEFMRRTDGSRQRLKPWLKKRQLAPWWRQRWPCVRFKGELLWVAGFGYNMAHPDAQTWAQLLRLDYQPGMRGAPLQQWPHPA